MRTEVSHAVASTAAARMAMAMAAISAAFWPTVSAAGATSLARQRGQQRLQLGEPRLDAVVGGVGRGLVLVRHRLESRR